jgi:FG-GAP-like repeat/FG-GAP repeat
MRPVPFACNCLMLASTLMLAQSGSTYPNQNRLPNVVRSGQSVPFGQHASRKSTVHQNGSQQAQGLSFANPVTYGSGGDQATSVAVADVNGDGKPDLLVTNLCGSNVCPAEGSVGVLLGNGDGTFKTAVTYDSGGFDAISIAVADVNGDGKPDLVVVNECTSTPFCLGDGLVAVLLGNGDGTFKTAVTYDSGANGALSVAIADMNGDGKPDLVVTNCSTTTNCANFGPGSVAVLLGNGDGTFQPAVVYPTGGDPGSVVVGDLKGDGKLDVVVAQCAGPRSSCEPGEVSVLLGNGDGTLQPPVNYSSGADAPGPTTLADVNGDGKLDIVVSNTFSPPNLHGNGAVGVLLGNGDGTFQTAVPYDLNGLGGALAVADVNGDGKPDVVVTVEVGSCTSSSTLAVLLGNGDGTFQPEVDFCSAGTPNETNDIAVADLKGNGRLDLVVATCLGSACAENGAVGVLINTGTKAQLSPTSLNFAPQAPGTNSSPQTVTLTNIGVAALTLSGISIGGTDATGFVETNNCPPTLATNASCQIKVTSVPNAAGAQTASLNITDSAPGSPQAVALTGMGQDFSLAVSSQTSMTVTPGQTANYFLAVSPLNGFSQKVALSCSGAPAQSTCTVSPSTVTLNGTGNATDSVAVVTAGSSARLLHPWSQSGSSRFAVWLGLPGLSCLLLFVGSGSHLRKRRNRWLRTLTLLGVVSLITIWPACGGGSSGSGSSGGTPAGTYTVAVTGAFTSGPATLTHTAKLTLVVN